MDFSTSAQETNLLPSLSDIYPAYMAPDHHGDKGTIHTYIDVYEQLLAPYRRNSTVLEIGVFYGLSLQMWQEYFIDSRIIGIDLTDAYVNMRFPERDFTVIVGNATDRSILDPLGDTTFDVVIDDGSHLLEDQVRTFNIFRERMKPGGLYIIEDIVDIDIYRHRYLSLRDGCEIIDHRDRKDRSDDVLAVYRY